MGIELIKTRIVIEHEIFKNLLYVYFELSHANLSFDYVPSNIRANNRKVKLVSKILKMKLNSNNIKLKSNTVTIEQSNKINITSGILKTLQSSVCAKIETIFDKKF